MTHQLFLRSDYAPFRRSPTHKTNRQTACAELLLYSTALHYGKLLRHAKHQRRRESGQLLLRLRFSFVRGWAYAELSALTASIISVSPLAVCVTRPGLATHPDTLACFTARRFTQPGQT